jgi:hypothetical protein
MQMERLNWDRIAAAMGLVFVALFVAAFIIFGEAPKLGDSAEEVAAYFVDDRSRIVTGAIIFGLATIAFAWFVGAVATTLRNAGEGRLGATAIAAGGAMIGIALVILALNVTQVIGVAATDPDAAKTINTIVWAFEVIISWPVAAFTLATAAGAMRAGIFPQWLSWASLAGAAVIALGGTTLAETGFWAADGEYTLITIIVFLVWTLAASWTFMQRVAAAEEPRTATAAA